MASRPRVVGSVRRTAARAQSATVRLLRRTPLRPRNTALLRYVGPRSGRRIELPVWAVPDASSGWLVAVGGSRGKSWWRAFRSDLAATIDAGSGPVPVTGRLVADEAERARLLEAYLERIPSARRSLSSDAPLIRFRVEDPPPA